MKKVMYMLLVMVCTASLFCLGCSKSEDTSSNNTSTNGLPNSLFLATAPTGVTPIADLRTSAKEGDEVTIKAVVGGRKQPFVANRAVMTVADASLKNPCLSEDDHCPAPWDYCCSPAEDLLPQLASVQIIGEDKRPLAIDLNQVEQLKPLNTLVIQGTVGPRTDEATLVIYAQGIFVAAQEG